MSALVYLLGEVMQAVLDIVLHVFNIRVKKLNTAIDNSDSLGHIIMLTSTSFKISF
jgi:hypothetical protein